jgi:hypothetical protein
VSDPTPLGGGLSVWPPDVSIMRTAHPNVLVTGTAAATRAFLDTIKPTLRAPVYCVAASEVPATCKDAGAIVMFDVLSLGGPAQKELLDWLREATASRPIQVITVAESGLFAEVESGRFLDTLYYFLSSVSFEVAVTNSKPSD